MLYYIVLEYSMYSIWIVLTITLAIVPFSRNETVQMAAVSSGVWTQEMEDTPFEKCWNDE